MPGTHQFARSEKQTDLNARKQDPKGVKQLGELRPMPDAKIQGPDDGAPNQYVRSHEAPYANSDHEQPYEPDPAAKCNQKRRTR